MNVHVVLVLAAFTGCIGSPVVAERQKPKLDIVFELLTDFISRHVQSAHSFYQDFKSTDYGKAVIKRVRENANAAGRTIDEVLDDLPESTKEIIIKCVQTSKDRIERMLADVSQYTVENHLEPMAEKAAPVIEEVVGALVLNSQPIQDVISPYINELMEIVESSLKDFQERLRASHQSLSKTE